MQKEKGGRSEPVQIHNHIYHQPGPATAAPSVGAMGEDILLIPDHYAAGEEMDIQKFVQVFGAPSSILQHFEQQAITGTYAFSYLSIADLKAMNFKIGEIIDLKRAIKLWASQY
jgi:hypothetical protein